VIFCEQFVVIYLHFRVAGKMGTVYKVEKNAEKVAKQVRYILDTHMNILSY
jgi:hypothetical protein